MPIGHDAPRSKNLTVSDVSDITTIDSSANPSPDMHTSTIAAAIAAGKPTLVLFAVPGYCTSQLCGPEYEIMRKLFAQYKDRVEFIHVESYKNPTSANRELVDAAKEWGLHSEPWFFVVGKDGKVSMKFEGPTSMQELQEALDERGEVGTPSQLEKCKKHLGASEVFLIRDWLELADGEGAVHGVRVDVAAVVVGAGGRRGEGVVLDHRAGGQLAGEDFLAEAGVVVERRSCAGRRRRRYRTGR